MLEHDHSLPLILAALAIALLAAFTGLSLTYGASSLPIGRRKLVVTIAAFALGSGTWSMHFVAMLGMRLPVDFDFDLLVTLISALVAVLVMGGALLLLHFRHRSPASITLAGICAAMGIVGMHYIGMSGIRLVRPVYSAGGIALAVVVALALCVGSVWIAYGRRKNRNILLGTLALGASVVAVHFVAMAGTHLRPTDGREAAGLGLSKEALAIGVTLTSFIISGASLLVGVTFAGRPTALPEGVGEPATVAVPPDPPEPTGGVPVPFEEGGGIRFVPDTEVAAFRAEGRYTFIYHSRGRLFCPWSISEAERKLAARPLHPVPSKLSGEPGLRYRFRAQEGPRRLSYRRWYSA